MGSDSFSLSLSICSRTTRSTFRSVDPRRRHFLREISDGASVVQSACGNQSFDLGARWPDVLSSMSQLAARGDASMPKTLRPDVSSADAVIVVEQRPTRLSLRISTTFVLVHHDAGHQQRQTRTDDAFDAEHGQSSPTTIRISSGSDRFLLQVNIEKTASENSRGSDMTSGISRAIFTR